MYEKLEECPSCKHPKFSNHIICKDHSVSGESFALMKCGNCGLIFTNPRPDEEHIGAYYKSDDYISHTNKANNAINTLYKQVRNVTLRQKLSLLQQYTPHKDILDFGCGTGTFLSYCSKHGYNVSGYEPDSDARSIAETTLGIPLIGKPSKLKKQENTFDIITAWHVVEHVHDLKGTIKLLKKKLKDKGVMFLAVPNHQSYDAQYYKEYWAAYDVPRHLYHFSQDSFSTLMQKCKLKVKAVHPMKFDSFYVSLLSEKYKSGKTNFIDAFNIGLTSNKKAKQTGEYSSLIYVLKK